MRTHIARATDPEASLELVTRHCEVVGALQVGIKFCDGSLRVC
jgi:hypothetical protein